MGVRRRPSFLYGKGTNLEVAVENGTERRLTSTKVKNLPKFERNRRLGNVHGTGDELLG